MKSFKEIANSARGIVEQNDTTEKVEMTQSQLHFIHYACEEILDFIKQGGEVEEWYQVKVAKSFSEFESLHSFIEGEKRRTGMVKEDDGTLERLRQGAQSYRARTPQGRFTTPKYKGQTHDKDPHGGGIFAKSKPLKTEEAEIDEAMAQPDYSQSIKARQAKADKENAPFDVDKKPVAKATPGKYGVGPSTAKHLAKMAMQKQMKKEEVELEEGSDYKVTVSHLKTDKTISKHDYDVKNANDTRHAKNIAINRHTDKHGLKQGEQIYSSSQDVKPMKEDVEQIDELSKKTLGNYVKSASHDVAAKAAATRQHSVDAHRKNTEGDFTGARDSMKKSDKSFSDSWKRRNNMAKAVDRLTKEEIESLEEKNVPTSPEKWAQAKAQAKAKFDVYPSAYANGWAAKKYKEMGGGWKSVNEQDNTTEPFYKSSRKAQIVKDIAKKKKSSTDTFHTDPIISKTEVKM